MIKLRCIFQIYNIEEIRYHKENKTNFRPIIRHEQKYDQLQIYKKKETAAGEETIQRC